MQRYLIRRLLLYIPVMIMVLSLVFFASALLPDYAEQRVSASATGGAGGQEAIKAIRRELGTDKPVYIRYWTFLADAARLDFGNSLLTKRPVTHELKSRISPSVELGVLQLLTAIALGVPFGIIAAIRQDRIIDYVVRFLATGWQAVPSFYMAALLLIIIPRWTGWTPPLTNTLWRGFFEDPAQNLRYLALPVLAGGAAAAAGIMRLLRSQLLEVLRQDYVRTALAKGLRERTVIARHVLKNGMIPVLTVIGLLIGSLFSGNVVLESIFGIPGIGLFAVNSIRQNDFPVLRGIVIIVATAVVFANLVVDLMYAWLDPRIRYT
jgi:peptide/nickel transport system permease protein